MPDAGTDPWEQAEAVAREMLETDSDPPDAARRAAQEAAVGALTRTIQRCKYVVGPADSRPPGRYRNGEDYCYYQVQCNGEVDTLMEHQLVMLMEGADPHKLFSNGDWHVHHENNLSFDNRPANLTVEEEDDHNTITSNGDTPMRDTPEDAGELSEDEIPPPESLNLR